MSTLKGTKHRAPYTISAVIACYKDALAIPIMHQRLVRVFEELGCKYEIIFVNDGSPDNSAEVIKTLVAVDPHVVGISHSRNFSSQMAFSSGMELATGDAVVLLDGDLQDPPEIIPAFVHQWRTGYDVVFGIRVKRQAPLIMQVAYKWFYRLFQKLSYISVPLDAGDFSLIDKKVVKVLQQFPERDRFLRGLRAWVGFKQIGVEYVRPERMFGVTTNNLLKNFQWATKAIFSFSYLPLQYMTLLSLIVFLIALIGIMIQIILRFLLPGTPQGITTILVTVLFIGAIQLLGISILGEYLAKIFEEVKQRPKFIVSQVMRHSTKSPRRRKQN